MINLSLENLFEVIALFIMIASLYLQVKYIKFKKRSMPASGVIKKINNHKIFYTAEIEFKIESKSHYGQVFYIQGKHSLNEAVDIIYNPVFIIAPDKSVVLTPLLRKINLLKFPTIFFSGQNPAGLHILLLILGSAFMIF